MDFWCLLGGETTTEDPVAEACVPGQSYWLELSCCLLKGTHLQFTTVPAPPCHLSDSTGSVPVITVLTLLLSSCLRCVYL